MPVQYNVLLNLIRRNPELSDVVATYIIGHRLPGWEEIFDVRAQCQCQDPIASGYTEYIEHFLIETR
jgi:hypothetical protein